MAGQSDDREVRDPLLRKLGSLLQENVLNRRHWQTRDQLRPAIITWIEKT
jgi:hypothetical protein